MKAAGFLDESLLTLPGDVGERTLSEATVAVLLSAVEPEVNYAGFAFYEEDSSAEASLLRMLPNFYELFFIVGDLAVDAAI